MRHGNATRGAARQATQRTASGVNKVLYVVLSKIRFHDANVQFVSVNSLTSLLIDRALYAGSHKYTFTTHGYGV